MNHDFLPLSNELYIFTIPMSKRLFNILRQHRIFYLSELSLYTRKEFSLIRGIGSTLLCEVDALLKKYNISFYEMPPVPHEWIRKHFYSKIIQYFSKANIKSLEDFNNKTTFDLYQICKQSYLDTMEIYYMLKEIGIEFKYWKDSFIFEYFNKRFATRLYRNGSFTYMTQLSNMSDIQFLSIRSIGVSGLQMIKNEVHKFYQDKK